MWHGLVDRSGCVKPESAGDAIAARPKRARARHSARNPITRFAGSLKKPVGRRKRLPHKNTASQSPSPGFNTIERLHVRPGAHAIVETVSSPLNFHLEQYDGPLDLLLDLIRKQQIDIKDIPIATITAQYLEI